MACSYVDLILLVAAEAASSIELMNHSFPCTVKKKLVNAPNERKSRIGKSLRYSRFNQNVMDGSHYE